MVGEIGMEATIAGDFGVPLWLITGDSEGIAEAEKLIPGIRGVAVKEAMGEFEAMCYSPKKTAKMIFNAARSVVQNSPSLEPFKIEGPVKMEIDLRESEYTSKLKNSYPEIFINGNTISLEGETVTAVWSKYSFIQKEVKNR